ncbi:MAG: porin [Candidatus Aminicenantes bacterium]|jgi:phosphate-selective porin
MTKEKSGKMRKSVFLFVIFCLLSLVRPSVAGQEESVSPANLSIKLNGYVQVRYAHYWDTGANGFRIRRARFGFKGEFLKNFNVKLQVDGTRSPVLLDAAVEISSIPYATLSFGQFKVPFSLENLTSSSALDLVNRTQTVEQLCPGQDIGSSGRDIGVTVSGKFSILEYTLGVFNGSGINWIDMNDQKDIVGRLILRPFDSLALGVSHYMGDQRLFGGATHVNRDRTGVDVFFSKGPAFIKGEYFFARDDQFERSGWYVRGAYSFIPEKLQALINYDSYDRDLDLAGNRIDVLTLGLNWFFSQKTKLQINYEHHRDEFAGTTDNAFLAQFQAYFEK